MPSKRNIENLEALTATLRGAEGSFFVVNYQGLEAGQTGKLRKAVREKGGTIIVAKNTLIRKAMSDLGLPAIEGLSGPSAVVIFNDPAGAAKALKEFAKTNDKGIPAFKSGVLSGQALTGSQVEALADLPSQKELQAELVGVLSAPMSNLVGVLGAKAQELVGILDARVQKLEAA
ncbi:MAG: 50S ribosomal protein L10 [Meiothermus sp.]|uniref:50S ribosomal protein L10 n=1 Tax=Meiothermus sp. TaxID=1955249 RepID=UPI0025DCCACD|nr:50S ribosomal protein L10 [Meiothermus sp.]MCS7068766.1 50S ribosomal protein L10 [Meiothermus sp.]MCX7600659.1 50S ribosomal protein L10 [Meiothermus sp.]MDW8426584.1 50S ribosomal protein L10 [Meiothermus sp.]